MRIQAIAAAGALLAALAGCGDSEDGTPARPRFSGSFGTAWEAVAPVTGQLFCRGFTDYSPAGTPSIYSFNGADGLRFDPAAATSGAWTSVAAAPADLGCYTGAAWVGGKLVTMQNDQVYEYAIAADSWTTPVTSTVGDTNDARVTHDDRGRVYTLENAAPYRVVRYDTASRTVTKLETGGLGENVNQPRVEWDPVTGRLLIGPAAFGSPELWSFDPEHPGTAVRRADVPAAGGGPGVGMGDAFCGDRSGHLYAIGDTGCGGSATVFQYDTRKDEWRRLPDLPEDHGCNASCTVSHDGWLYLTPGDTQNVYRLRLL